MVCCTGYVLLSCFYFICDADCSKWYGVQDMYYFPVYILFVAQTVPNEICCAGYVLLFFFFILLLTDGYSFQMIFCYTGCTPKLFRLVDHLLDLLFGYFCVIQKGRGVMATE